MEMILIAGVRMINLSYSRISLADIAQKLLLDSPEDAEYIVAKVICHLLLLHVVKCGKSDARFETSNNNILLWYC